MEGKNFRWNVVTEKEEERGKNNGETRGRNMEFQRARGRK